MTSLDLPSKLFNITKATDFKQVKQEVIHPVILARTKSLTRLTRMDRNAETKIEKMSLRRVPVSVTRLGDFFNFGQLFKAISNN